MMLLRLSAPRSQFGQARISACGQNCCCGCVPHARLPFESGSYDSCRRDNCVGSQGSALNDAPNVADGSRAAD